MKQQTVRLVMAGVLALLSMVLPSCKKGCYECTCQDGGVTKTYPICRDDYESQKQFTSTLKQFENGTYGDCVCTRQ